jgi:hypothetical protein
MMMNPAIGKAIKEAAKFIFTEVILVYADDIKDSVANAARDNVERIITGRRTIEDWSKICIEAVDKIKDHAVNEEGLRYVGGKLKFAMSQKKENKAVISFELYFQDKNNEWHKIGAESDLYASNFTLEALDEIKSAGGVSFEVE